MDKFYYGKDGREFVVRFCEREIFIGTAGFVSNIAAQIISHNAVEPLHWESTKTACDLVDSKNHLCVAVGYKIPESVNAQERIEELFS